MDGTLTNTQLQELNKQLNRYTDNLNIKKKPSYDDLDYVEENKKLIQTFLDDKLLEGCSKRTITAYKNVLDKFNEWTIKHLLNITKQDITDYLLFYKETRNASNSTIDNIRRYLRSFYGYCLYNDLILKNPAANLGKIKTVKKQKVPFTNEEITKMRTWITNRKYGDLRDLAIFELLLSSGIRVGELHNLNISDMDMVNNKFRVIGKGDKERVCYFNSAAKIALEDYLNSRKDDNPALFVTLKSKKKKESLGRTYVRLGINPIERRIREIGQAVGVKAHPHKFRRTFATNLVKKGVNVAEVGKLLGHESIETTLIYTVTEDDTVKYDHEKHIDI
ncbi:MAG: tyrosine-type recombinase/integrase [Methanobrevibacter sp.]|nr:tyrosine-type recombinase/integrase [Methanobrevibacter sp.]